MNEHYTHSIWVQYCPLQRDGDKTTMLAAPVTCPYCRNALRLTTATERITK